MRLSFSLKVAFIALLIAGVATVPVLIGWVDVNSATVMVHSLAIMAPLFVAVCAIYAYFCPYEVHGKNTVRWRKIAGAGFVVVCAVSALSFGWIEMESWPGVLSFTISYLMLMISMSELSDYLLGQSKEHPDQEDDEHSKRIHRGLEYAGAVSQFGVESEQAQSIRRRYAGNAEFEEFAEGVDRLKRNLFPDN